MIRFLAGTLVGFFISSFTYTLLNITRDSDRKENEKMTWEDEMNKAKEEGKEIRCHLTGDICIHNDDDECRKCNVRFKEFCDAHPEDNYGG